MIEMPFKVKYKEFMNLLANNGFRELDGREFNKELFIKKYNDRYELKIYFCYDNGERYGRITRPKCEFLIDRPYRNALAEGDDCCENSDFYEYISIDDVLEDLPRDISEYILYNLELFQGCR